MRTPRMMETEMTMARIAPTWRLASTMMNIQSSFGMSTARKGRRGVGSQRSEDAVSLGDVQPRRGQPAEISLPEVGPTPSATPTGLSRRSFLAYSETPMHCPVKGVVNSTITEAKDKDVCRAEIEFPLGRGRIVPHAIEKGHVEQSVRFPVALESIVESLCAFLKILLFPGRSATSRKTQLTSRVQL